MNISAAGIEDIPELVKLINSPYRGEVSRKGWTTEADLLKGGQRTDIPDLEENMKKPGAVFLKYTSVEGPITGCVFLQQQERGIYLGMLSVAPHLQASGIGKKLMDAAIRHAREKKCTRIFMNVISVRHELIAWYTRLGYRVTGKNSPMPVDPRFGLPVQPLEFVLLEMDI